MDQSDSSSSYNWSMIYNSDPESERPPRGSQHWGRSEFEKVDLKNSSIKQAAQPSPITSSPPKITQPPFKTSPNIIIAGSPRIYKRGARNTDDSSPNVESSFLEKKFSPSSQPYKIGLGSGEGEFMEEETYMAVLGSFSPPKEDD